MAETNDQDGAPDDAELVRAFLKGRDVVCPLCGYNLRDLTETRCPECRKELTLAVSLRELRFGWLLATVTPGFFSGIAAGLLLIPLVLVPLGGGGPAPWFVLIADAFGWLSGLGALVLVRYRHAFLRQSTSRQQVWALLAWAVHIWAFVLFVTVAFTLF